MMCAVAFPGWRRAQDGAVGAGIGAEPASCATVAGVKKLVESGVIAPSDDVVGILTGHVLKDPEVVVDYHMKGQVDGMKATRSNPPIKAQADLVAIKAALASNT